MLYSKFAFPVFTWITILVILIPVVFIVIYRHFYKKHLDKVINDSRYHKKMASPFEVVIASIIVVLFVGVFVSFFSGYKLAQNYYENMYEDMVDHFSATDIETYYAEVKMINDNIIFVDGISINEEKYQGEFKYEVSGEVSIVKDDKIITLEQLNEGDLVSVVLVAGEGHIQGITDVFKITVIDEAD